MKAPTIKQLLAQDANNEQKRWELVTPGRRLPFEFRREVAAFVLEVEQKAASLSGERDKQRLASVAEKWRLNLHLADPSAQPEPPRKASFKYHIRLMFSDKDLRCMKNIVDLSKYEVVKEHAKEILTRLRGEGGPLMPYPPAGPWPPEWIALFERWITEGCPE